MVRIGINGFGRIGRILFRAAYKKLDIVAINSPADTQILAQLLKHDSVYGKFPGKIKYTKSQLIVDGKKIKVFHEQEPEKIPWKENKVDIVAECVGIFKTKELASKHLKAGAKKVLIGAPGEGVDLTVVKGVNEEKLKKNHIIVSNASCTTNCLAPIAKVLNDAVGIKRGVMVTIHSYTSTQNTVDGSHKDLRRARAAAANIVPTSSGAAIATQEVIPTLKGKLHSSAMRVPILDGSVILLACEIKKKTTVKKVNNLFKKAAGGKYKGIIEYSDEPLVSTDCIGNSHSAIFDSKLTEIDGDLLKVIAWYDNEWGYCCRMADILKLMGKG